MKSERPLHLSRQCCVRTVHSAGLKFLNCPQAESMWKWRDSPHPCLELPEVEVFHLDSALLP